MARTRKTGENPLIAYYRLLVIKAFPKREANGPCTRSMRITRQVVVRERDRVRERSVVVVPLVNAVREDLEELFEVDLPSITDEAYRAEVDQVFDDGDRAVNLAALTTMLRELDVEDDYPGFVVDELLGRKLAAWIAGEQPLSVLAEASFHYADVVHDPDPDGEANAGLDDMDVALAAGFQTRLPGWEWRERESPFGP